jgi:hypothetical protein
MNKQIRPLGAMLIVLVIATLVGLYVWTKGEEISSSIETQNVPIKSKGATKNDQIADKDKSEIIAENQKLSNAVYIAVEEKTKGKWDKKIDISAFDGTKKAAKGKWWAKDAWDWIAWLQDSGEWKVLISADGFICQDLKNVPSEYDDFFHDVIIMKLRDGGERRNCQ